MPHLEKRYAEVALALPVFKTLTYGVPPELRPHAEIGKRVLVPVQKTQATGYILDSLEDTPQEGVKEVRRILDASPLFPAAMVAFFRWIADYYMVPIGEVIKGALPSGLNARQVRLMEITERGRSQLTSAPGATLSQNEVLAWLDRQGPATASALSSALNRHISYDVLGRMERDGLLVERRSMQGGRVRPKTERYARKRNAISGNERLSAARRQILSLVEAHGEVSVSKIKETVPTAPALVRKMTGQGLLEIVEKEVYRDPFGDPIERDPAPLPLTRDQEAVMAQVIQALDGPFKTFLLHGVTGSGKTEVYMHAAEASLHKGRPVLVLVPEIALISQTERLFRARFGDCVALLHSGLSQGERLDQWMRIVRKEAQIAIGARSAVFAPFDRLGLVIVDEEHDDSYKQETRVRYHARDLAVVRAKLQNAVALLGSATPSVQSYHNMRSRRYHGLCLEKRIENQPLPEVTVVDLRPQGQGGRAKPFLTRELKQAMEEALGRGEQVLLFLNRRGFASYPTCTACGTPVRCKNCDVTMTFHQGANAFRCHYCGYSQASASGCAVCGNAAVKPLGFGTEKVEAKIQEAFPGATVARMDRDTTQRKGALLRILKDLRRGAIDILVGTQMVAKGHHYPNITLVGILCADLSLNFPDFRAGERTFQLLAQVAGRAGRGDRPGRVILQTFNPDHFCITAAAAQAYPRFYEEEAAFRKDLQYPPYARLTQVLMTGKDQTRTARFAKEMGHLCRQLQKKDRILSRDIQVLGPVAAPLARIKKQYRWHMLLKGKNARSLHRLASHLREAAERESRQAGTKIVLNMDPVDML